MKPIHDFYEFNYGKTKYRFLPTGDVFDFTYDNIMINQFRSNPKDGSANNIYLRIYNNDTITSYPLLGIRSRSVLKKGKQSLAYCGVAEGISYEITFRGADKLWFWEIELSGNGEQVDLLYGQDIGNASMGGVLTNELYTAQYLGHTIFSSETGYVVCSRQNQDQGGAFPFVQQGTLGVKTLHYSTDGLQFFGTTYKATDRPEVLSKDLPDVNYQFEFSYIGLQTEKFCVNSSKQAVFYGLFMENYKTAVSEMEDLTDIKESYLQLPEEEEPVCCDLIQVKDIYGEPFASKPLNQEEIFELFPSHMLEELEDDVLLSFFTDSHSHIVTMQKELITERPHGSIITTCIDMKNVNSNLITSTNYMYGLFNGQTVIGNTSFHKFLSTPRGLLNIQKNCGQHLYVKIEGKYRLLTIPALYEMGMNYSKWYYVLPGDMLIVTSYTAAKETSVILEVASQKKISYDYILTNQLVLGEHEYTKELHAVEIMQGYRFYMDQEEYPGLHYDLQIPQVPYEISDDRIFFTDATAKDETFLTISIQKQNRFQCIISGYLQDAPATTAVCFSFEKEISLYQDFYKQLNRNFYLKSPVESQQKQLDILNQTAWWYSHNAMVHYAVPHGLEQPGGAAWGTRDVCQGPMEYFLATQNYELAGKVLLNIFSHQNSITGEWPQWFMFDRYQMDAGECHGDVVFWPLKCVSDYIKGSGDYSLLGQILPYADNEERKETLLQHIKEAFAAIQERFVGNTGLLTYAGGDWDDTLQPADPVMKEHLVSSWTVALAYQTLCGLSQVLKPVDAAFSTLLSESVTIIRRDFSSLLIQDGVIAGFARQEKEGFTYILHPSDQETGIQYRLIPMTRSIIAELVEPNQAANNMDTIHRELKFSDGVRLMNQPAHYNGGISKLFKRAEQAANVGREISLQYTHAHIRYIEACAKCGDAREAWKGLFTVNPIQIQQSVPTAARRQSNMYFSSSDGLFMDRYDYAENFSRLKEGTIPVKGGWRLYSSGPGIYLNQLISNVLGIRFSGDYLIIDPVVPYRLNEMEFTYTCFDKILTFRYHIGENSVIKAKSNGRFLPSEELFNPYRRGGIQIHRNEFECDTPLIDLYL
jgi:cellobiose phosphorylase